MSQAPPYPAGSRCAPCCCLQLSVLQERGGERCCMLRLARPAGALQAQKEHPSPFGLLRWGAAACELDMAHCCPTGTQPW